MFLTFAVSACAGVCAQQPAQESGKAPEKAVGTSQDDKAAKAKTEEKAAVPFQIELLETRVRFEANGDSRKEVHTVVKIKDAGGARQFARLGFDYNRAFQSVRIPLVKIAHANGGTSEILPSAIGDVANPATEKFPAYQDVRVKTVRILGLEEGDTLEYRVITTTTKPPLAPDFWLEHTFDRSGQVAEEHYEIDLPSERHPEIRISPETPAIPEENSSAENSGRAVYRWVRTYAGSKPEDSETESPGARAATPDISLSTLGWDDLAVRMAELLLPGSRSLRDLKTYEEQTKELSREPEVSAEVNAKALSLTRDSKTDLERFEAIYHFVSTQIRTVDLPLGAMGFAAHPATEVLHDGYANAEDKYVLFRALAQALKLQSGVALTGYCDKKAVAVPTKFRHLIILVRNADKTFGLDPSLEVAPFGMIPSVPEKCKFVLKRSFYALASAGQEWEDIPMTSPFAAFQKVRVEASLALDGKLTASVKYVMRGDNELVLREAFHQTPRERWNEVAGLLALADGFRGHIESVKASDPMETEKAFEVEYEITQPKFLDWAKKPVRIPALLPQLRLPDLPGKEGGKIELGTPLDVETQMTLRLPEGTTVETPPGTSVSRDYAMYASNYDRHLNTVTASRHVRFLMREIPEERAADYNAFSRAVNNDEAQAIVLFPGEQTKKN